MTCSLSSSRWWTPWPWPCLFSCLSFSFLWDELLSSPAAALDSSLAVVFFVSSVDSLDPFWLLAQRNPKNKQQSGQGQKIAWPMLLAPLSPPLTCFVLTTTMWLNEPSLLSRKEPPRRVRWLEFQWGGRRGDMTFSGVPPVTHSQTFPRRLYTPYEFGE
jgi:hypothetical protein